MSGHDIVQDPRSIIKNRSDGWAVISRSLRFQLDLKPSASSTSMQPARMQLLSSLYGAATAYGTLATL